MADNKNQHFVPKAYLRPFGSNDGKSINLHALASGRSVEGASIKGQCSRNYFYGQEPIFDEFIRHFEGGYGEAIKRLVNWEVEPRDIKRLLDFFVLQYLRTPHQLQQRLQVFEGYQNTVIGGQKLKDSHPPAQEDFQPQREMQQQIYVAAKAIDMLDDLRSVLLINRTATPFITSDNPACLTNRLYSQRYQDGTSGLIQCGVAVYLPLTARLAFIAYDADVYQTFGNGLEHHVWNANDVDRLNELQGQVATETLYFADWKDSEYAEKVARECADRRRESWTFIWTAIRDGEDAFFEKFRTATEADDESTEPRITSVSMYTAVPSTWPTFLKFKLRPKGHRTGTAVGYIRSAHCERMGIAGSSRITLPDVLADNERIHERGVMLLRKGRPSKLSKLRQA